MDTVSIHDLVRKDIPLAYRRTYTAQALISGRNTGETRHNIEFDIEHTPLGSVEISVRFQNKPSYPLLPLLKGIRERIAILDREGSLP